MSTASQIVFIVGDDVSVRESLDLSVGSENWKPEIFACAQHLDAACLKVDQRGRTSSFRELREHCRYYRLIVLGPHFWSDEFSALSSAYERHDDWGHWYRSYGNDKWEFNDDWLMASWFDMVSDWSANRS